MTVAEMHYEVAYHLSQIQEMFKADVLLTFIARAPGNDNADVFIGNDDPQAVMDLCARTMARDAPSEEQ